MKKGTLLAIIITMIFMLCACGEDNSIQNTTNDIQQSEIENTEKKIMVDDLSTFQHESKRVFQEYLDLIGRLSKVELNSDKTVATYFISFEDESYSEYLKGWKEEEIKELIKKLSHASSYNDFFISDINNNFRINVECLNEQKRVKGFDINGYSNFNDFLLEDRDMEFNNFLKANNSNEINKNILSSGDVNADGVDEKLIRYVSKNGQEALYLVKCNSDGTYKNLGQLIDDYSGDIKIINADIINIDNSSKKSIVVNISTTDNSASGYLIYRYDGCVNQVLSVYPDSEFQSTKELRDSNNDGIYEHINKYVYSDMQGHELIKHEDFSTGNTWFEMKYNNKQGEFIYPKSPEDVVKSFIEAKCLVWKAVSEIENELMSMADTEDVANSKLQFYQESGNTRKIDIETEIVCKTDGMLVIQAYQESSKQKAYLSLYYKDNAWKISGVANRDQATVQNNDELKKAIKSGAVIVLPYEINIDDTIKLKNLKNIVLIGNQSIITVPENKNYLDIEGCSNIVLDGIDFSSSSNGIIQASYSSNIIINDCSINGGITVSNSNNIKIRDNSINGGSMQNIASFSSSKYIDCNYNAFYDAYLENGKRKNAISFNSCSNVNVIGNNISNTKSSRSFLGLNNTYVYLNNNIIEKNGAKKIVVSDEFVGNGNIQNAVITQISGNDSMLTFYNNNTQIGQVYFQYNVLPSKAHLYAFTVDINGLKELVITEYEKAYSPKCIVNMNINKMSYENSTTVDINNDGYEDNVSCILQKGVSKDIEDALIIIFADGKTGAVIKNDFQKQFNPSTFVKPQLSISDTNLDGINEIIINGEEKYTVFEGQLIKQ